jgi:hypothetical protein
MSDAKIHQRLIAGLALIGIIMLCATGLATVHNKPRSETLTDDVAKLIGDWTGESICVGNNPSCHDEKVVYHISRLTGEPGKVRIAADKIVNGKPEPMGVLDFKYDAAKGTLAGEFQNSRYHGLWEYTVKGNTMEGTLSLLPDKTIVRRIKVKKDV